MARTTASLFLILHCALCNAATYYVDNSPLGSDSNDGKSAAKPWASVAKVNRSTFQAGDSVLFKRGDVWHEQLIIPASGSATSPITFATYGTGADPILDGGDVLPYCLKGAGQSYITLQGIDTTKCGDYAYAENFYLVDGSHGTISGVTSTHATSLGTTGSGIKVLSFPESTVQNCVTHDNAGTGIYVRFSNNSIVNNCTSYANGIKGIGVAGDIVGDIVTPITGVLVESCKVYNNIGDGIHLDYAVNTTIRGCSISGSPGAPNKGAGDGINNDTGSTGTVVSSCTISNNLSCGIEGAGGPGTSGTVDSCTFSANRYNIDALNGKWTITNCTSLSPTGVTPRHIRILPHAVAAGTTLDHNDYHPDGPYFSWNGTVYNTFAEYQAASGQDKHSTCR